MRTRADAMWADLSESAFFKHHEHPIKPLETWKAWIFGRKVRSEPAIRFNPDTTLPVLLSGVIAPSPRLQLADDGIEVYC